MHGLRIGSLFSGIGGLELGLERAGVGKTVWQCEIDPWARGILARHWPGVKCHDDIRTFDPSPNSADLICGGFPCQDISQAGQGAGIKEGTRSGLWSEYIRIVRKVRPRFVLVENVAILRKRGLDKVLGDLASSRYDAEWDCIPAASVGAPHLRDRMFILAHRNNGGRLHGQTGFDAAEARFPPQRQPVPSRKDVGHASSGGRPWALLHGEQDRQRYASHTGRWPPEPNVGRVADGVPGRVDRIRGLGNSVVPAVAESIGRRLMQAVGKQEAKE